MKAKQTIADVMTAFPHSVGADIELPVAVEKMRELGVHHLPVRKGGELVGILSDRDLKLSLSFTDSRKLQVQDAMTADPYTVTPDTPLRKALHEIVAHRYGCILVADTHGKLQGIFTATDGLRLLEDLLA